MDCLCVCVCVDVWLRIAWCLDRCFSLFLYVCVYAGLCCAKERKKNERYLCFLLSLHLCFGPFSLLNEGGSGRYIRENAQKAERRGRGDALSHLLLLCCH
jgi:hypothetical protein